MSNVVNALSYLFGFPYKGIPIEKTKIRVRPIYDAPNSGWPGEMHFEVSYPSRKTVPITVSSMAKLWFYVRLLAKPEHSGICGMIDL